MNWWYAKVGTTGYPTRAELDEAKARLNALVRRLGSIARALDDDPDVRSAVSTVFSRETIDAATAARRKLPDFIAEHEGELVELRDRVGVLTSEVVGGVERALDEAIVEVSRAWSPEVHRDFLVRYLGFPFWDVLVHPVSALSGLDERDEVEVMRISPMERRLLLRPDGTRDPLIGVGLGHFGAFFSRRGREADYLWGRLDAAERLVALLFDEPDEPGVAPPDVQASRRAFEAILRSEATSLGRLTDLMADLGARVAALRDGGAGSANVAARGRID